MSRRRGGMRAAAVVAGLCVLVTLAAAGCVDIAEVPADPSGASDNGDIIEEAAPMVIVSSAFADGDALPVSSANDAQNESPALAWSGAPEGTRSFVLVCVDLHPLAGGWVHWLAVDLPAGTAALGAGASGSGMPDGARELENGFGEKGWGGPQPPAGSGTHDYEFTIHALDVEALDVPADAGLAEVESAIEGHVLGSATLTGTFER